jgi:hypothetical protein
MIRITIELLPLGREEHKRHLGTAEIWNDASGDGNTGNYKFRLSKWGGKNELWKSGEIKGFPRQSRGAWDLLYLCLKSVLEKRNS